MQKVWLDITRWAGLLPEEFLNATWVTIPSFLCARLWRSGCFSSRWFLYKAHEESLSTFTATWAIGNFFFFFFPSKWLCFSLPRAQWGEPSCVQAKTPLWHFGCAVWSELSWLKVKVTAKLPAVFFMLSVSVVCFFFMPGIKTVPLGLQADTGCCITISLCLLSKSQCNYGSILGWVKRQKFSELSCPGQTRKTCNTCCLFWEGL